MVEPFGTAAGAVGLVSLAIQLTESAVKIRQFYSLIKDAPQTLADIAHELDTYGLVLTTLDRDQQAYSCVDSTILTRCVHQCNRAVERVRLVSDGLETAMHASKFKGRLRTAFSRSELKRVCDELNDAKTSLALAHSLYAEARRAHDADRLLKLQEDNNLAMLQQTQLLSAQSQAIRQMLRRVSDYEPGISAGREFRLQEEPIEQVMDTKSSTGSSHSQLTCQQERRLQAKSRRRWRLYFSSWYASNMWELSFSMSQNAISFKLKTSRLVPPNAPIFEACREGDLDQVRLLFQNGYASPLDYNYDEWAEESTTALTAAASSRNVQVLQYLLDIADEPVAPSQSIDAVARYDRKHNMRLQDRTHTRPSTDAVEQYRLLVEHSELDLDYYDSSYRQIDMWWRACPDIACMKLLRNRIISEHGQHARQHLVDNAISGSEDLHLPDMFLTMLGYEDVVDEVKMLQDSKGRTALHLAICQLPDCVENVDSMVAASWCDFIVKLVKLGADVHKQEKSAMSPLIALLEKSRYYCSRSINNALQTWLQVLTDAGVDLIDYGETERVLWNEWQPHRPLAHGNAVVNWTSGPRVSDWAAQVRYWHVLCIYRLDTPPGTWPAYKEDEFWTIFWEPTEEDKVSASWTWKEVDRAVLRSQEQADVDAIDPNSEDSPPVRWSVSLVLLRGSQDDCREAVRLVERCCRPPQRPRSSSQPATTARKHGNGRVDVWTSHIWLPPCHFCLGDGQLRFGHTDEDKFESWPRSNAYERRCAKGVHDFAPDDIWYGPHGIKPTLDRYRRGHEHDV